MIILSVMYPRRDGARFDKTYYGNKHVPLVKDVFGPGLKGAQVMRGLSAAVGSPRAAEVFGDIANFTDIQPATQISQQVG